MPRWHRLHESFPLLRICLFFLFSCVLVLGFVKILTASSLYKYRTAQFARRIFSFLVVVCTCLVPEKEESPIEDDTGSYRSLL